MMTSGNKPEPQTKQTKEGIMSDVTITPVALPEKAPRANPYADLVPQVKALADQTPPQAAQAVLPNEAEAKKFKKVFGEAANAQGLRRKFLADVVNADQTVTVTFTVAVKKEREPKAETEATEEGSSPATVEPTGPATTEVPDALK